MIRLLIVEDHPAIGAGLKALLDDEPDLQVVGTASDEHAATRVIESDGPDVVLCDVMLSGEDAGLSLLRRFGRPSTKFLMFSAYTYPDMHRSALDAGAAGYLAKTAPIEDIVHAIRTVAAGGKVFPPGTLRSARGARPRPSQRELEVITLIARGASNRDVARVQSVGIKTVESRLRRLFDRYAVANRTELARVAESEGWLIEEASP